MLNIKTNLFNHQKSVKKLKKQYNNSSSYIYLIIFNISLNNIYLKSKNILFNNRNVRKET